MVAQCVCCTNLASVKGSIDEKPLCRTCFMEKFENVGHLNYVEATLYGILYRRQIFHLISCKAL